MGDQGRRALVESDKNEGETGRGPGALQDGHHRVDGKVCRVCPEVYLGGSEARRTLW